LGHWGGSDRAAMGRDGEIVVKYKKYTKCV